MLEAYFRGETLGVEAYACLLRRAHDLWRHPGTAKTLPPCAKVVLLEDAARGSKVFGGSQRDCAQAAFRAVHTELPTPESIRLDMTQLRAMLAQCCFSAAPPGPGAGWHKAQIEYLTIVRRRPGLARQVRDSQPGVSTLGLSLTPAAASAFEKAIRIQSSDVTVHGLLGAFRIKAWVHARGWSISLGTIGIERWWRSFQRMIRNRSRSRACLDTVNVIIVQRWVRALQARALTPGCRHRWRDVAYEAQHSLAAERLAAALLQDTAWEEAPLEASGAERIRGRTEAHLALVYEAFREGRVA